LVIVVVFGGLKLVEGWLLVLMSFMEPVSLAFPSPQHQASRTTESRNLPR